MRKSIPKLLVILLVFVFVLSFTATLFAQDEEGDYEFTAKDKVILNQPSICYISTVYYGYIYDPNTAAWSEQYYYGPLGGTGFCVNPDTGHIVTAAHVIEDDYVTIKWSMLDAYIYDVYPDDYFSLTDTDWNWVYDNYKVEGENQTEPDREVWVQFNTAAAGIPENPDNTYLRAEVIDSSPWEQRDIAVVKIQPTTGRALSSSLVGDSSQLEIQDPLTIIGYPWNADISWESIMTPTITSGIISARKMLSGTEVLQIDGTAAPGNSGGPVLNENGEVIGILTMGISGENINYLRPSNDIKEMLDRNGIANKMGMVDDNFAKGLAMFRQSHHTEAIKFFDSVLNLSQGHLLAQEYKAKAQTAIERGEDIPLEPKAVAEEEPVDAETVQAEDEESIETSPFGEEIAVEEPADEATPEESGGLSNLAVILIIIGVVFFVIVVAVIILIIALVTKKKNAKTAEPIKETEQETEKEKAEGKKFCPSCGSEAGKDQKFCSNCGHKLD